MTPLANKAFLYLQSVLSFWILVAIFLVYLIRATNALSKMLKRKDVDQIGDTTKEMVEDIKDSVIFNFLFRKKKRSRKK
jgi:hypothetical protein